MIKALLVMALVLFISCGESKDLLPLDTYTIDEELEKWSDSLTKSIIKEVSNLKIDSVSIDSTSNKFFYYQYHFSQGKNVKAFAITKNLKDTVSFLYNSIRSDFIANGENCVMGDMRFNQQVALHNYRGLKYKEHHIGLATYIQCDSSSFEKGFYFGGNRIGKWIKMDKEGNIVNEQEYGDISKLKDMIRK